MVSVIGLQLDEAPALEVKLGRCCKIGIFLTESVVVSVGGSLSFGRGGEGRDGGEGSEEDMWKTERRY